MSVEAEGSMMTAGRTRFSLLRRTRQTEEYSCGACALQCVLGYWDKDVAETELIALLRTTPEEGTYPEDIVRVARSFGFQAEARDGLALEEVKRETAAGYPVITLGQAWRSERHSAGSTKEGWDDGHYDVVLGVDVENVYFQDPFMRMSKAFVPRKVFEKQWRQVMGGDLRKNPKLIRLGIFIRGENHPKPKISRKRTLSPRDFGRFGSLNLVVAQFPGSMLPFDFLTELKETVNVEQVRHAACVFLRKDRQGNLSGIEGSGLQEDEHIVAANALLAAIASRGVAAQSSRRAKVEAAIRQAGKGDFGLSAGDLQKVGERLPANHSAMIFLFENVWERRFRELTARRKGVIVRQELITSEKLVKAAGALL